jgi:hypothetical protein
MDANGCIKDALLGGATGGATGGTGTATGAASSTSGAAGAGTAAGGAGGLVRTLIPIFCDTRSLTLILGFTSRGSYRRSRWSRCWGSRWGRWR